MTLLTGLTNVMSSVPVPDKVQKLFLETSKEGWKSIAPLETSVIAGRSAAAAKRGGFMEFQERFVEEVVVAIIWLFGVDAMRRVFDKALPKLFKGADHLSPEVAWRKMGKSNNVELAAQELFTKNASEVSKLLKIKGLRWLFSVGTIMFTVALVIPRLNQLKTEWIIKYEEAKAKKKSAPAPAGGHPVAPMARTTPAPAFGPIPSAPGFNFSPMLTPNSRLGTETPVQAPRYGQASNWVPGQPIHAPTMPPASLPMFRGQGKRNPGFDGEGTPIQPAGSVGIQPSAPKFAGMGGVLQALGHAVEQTPYGSILVVDAGITGGRGVVASKRSIFETVEVVFRDAVSLYFYIMFAPQLVKAISKAVDPLLGTSLRIEPKVVEALHDELWRRADQMAAANPALKAMLARGEMPVPVLREIMEGSPHQLLSQAEGALRNQLRMAQLAGRSGEGFMPILQKEAAAYLGGAEPGAKWAEAVGRHLQTHLSDKGAVLTDDLLKLLETIEQGAGEFATLGKAERANLSTAIKQAFRHSVGIPVDLSETAIRKMALFREIIKGLPAEEQQALIARIQRMARQDGLDQVNTMVRRSLNLSREGLGEAGSPLIKRLEAQADLIDRAVNRGVGLDDMLRRELGDLKAALAGQSLPDALKARIAVLEDATPAQLREIEAELQKLSGKKLQKLAGQLQGLTALFAEGGGDRKAVQAIQEDVLGAIRELGEKAAATSDEGLKGVVEAYGKRIAELLGGSKGHLFTMYINPHEQGITDKILEMMRGGLKRESGFIREAQDIVGHLITDSRRYADPGKSAEMRHLVGDYVEKLLAHAEKAAVAGEAGALKIPAAKELLTRFFRTNRLAHYFARVVALGSAMYCIGILVPKMQYALTKRLTGKNEHPGIAKAAHHDQAGAGASASRGTEGMQPVPVASALNRNNFQAFKRHA